MHDLNNVFHKGKPLWRVDPQESCSDLTIEITSKASQVTKCYHVHKVHLVFGQHKSEFFATAIKKGGPLAGRNEFRLELEDSAAHAFPYFVDFLYTGQDFVSSEELSLSKALVLLHLADVFKVPTLVDEMKHFVMDRMTADSLRGCLPLVVTFRKDKSMKTPYLLSHHLMVEAVLAQHPHLPDLVDGMDVPFVVAVLKMCSKLVVGRNMIDTTDHDPVSKAALLYLESNKDEITTKSLYQVTNSKYLPSIAASIALRMLELESEILENNKKRYEATRKGKTSKNDGSNRDENDSLTVEEEEASSTSLQERCIDALTKDMSRLDAIGEAGRIFKKLTRPQLAELLVRTISNRFAVVEHRNATSAIGKDGDCPIHHVKVLSIYAELNGSYKYLPPTGEYPKRYIMKGEWLGKPSKFYIWRSRDGNWRLGYQYEDAPSYSIREVSVARNCPNSDTPPAWGWESAKALKHFPVFLLFSPGDVPTKKPPTSPPTPHQKLAAATVPASPDQDQQSKKKAHVDKKSVQKEPTRVATDSEEHKSEKKVRAATEDTCQKSTVGSVAQTAPVERRGNRPTSTNKNDHEVPRAATE